MKGSRGAVIVPVLALALVMAACSSSDGSTSGGTSTSQAPPTTATSSAEGGAGGGGSSASITAQGFAFSPDQVNVSAGTVTLTVTNEDSVEHTFTLDDGSSNTDLPPGTTMTIRLDLTRTVGFHCSIHPSMTGTLNVG